MEIALKLWKFVEDKLKSLDRNTTWLMHRLDKSPSLAYRWRDGSIPALDTAFKMVDILAIESGVDPLEVLCDLYVHMTSDWQIPDWDEATDDLVSLTFFLDSFMIGDFEIRSLPNDVYVVRQGFNFYCRKREGVWYYTRPKYDSGLDVWYETPAVELTKERLVEELEGYENSSSSAISLCYKDSSHPKAGKNG